MIDDKEIEKLENSAVKLTVTVSAEKTEKVYTDLLAKHGKQVHIPGFRKGKVPRDVLIRKIGEGINQEAATEILDEALTKALEDAEERPISQPLMTEFHGIAPGQPYKFTVTYDVFPRIVMGEYKGLEIEEPQVDILDKHEDEELKIIRERNSVVVDKEDGIVADESLVTIGTVELGEDDEPLEETRRTGFVFTVGRFPHPYAIEAEIEGMKVGENRVIEKTYDDDAPQGLAGRTIKLHVSIAAVKERQLPDLDDELAQDVAENLQTLDDLKKKVRADLRQRADDAIRDRKVGAINDKLLAGCAIQLPESMVKAELERNWHESSENSGISEDDLIATSRDNGREKAAFMKEWREDAEKALRLRIIYRKILEKETLEATDEELTDYINEYIERLDIKKEEFEKRFGDDYYREYFKSQLNMKKLVDFLLSAASVKKDGRIDYKDLMEG